jgi:hypothetical protein
VRFSIWDLGKTKSPAIAAAVFFATELSSLCDGSVLANTAQCSGAGATE